MAASMLSVPLVLHDDCTQRSPSCPTMTPTNPTMKDATIPKPARPTRASCPSPPDPPAACLRPRESDFPATLHDLMPTAHRLLTLNSHFCYFLSGGDNRWCLKRFSASNSQPHIRRRGISPRHEATTGQTTTGRRARPRIATPATYGASSAERGNYHEQERQGGTRRPRAQVQQSNREPRFQRFLAPQSAFLDLHTCAFSLISSACFLWQVTALMPRREGQAAAPREAEIHKTRNPRPFTGFFFCLYMHPNRPGRASRPQIGFISGDKPGEGLTSAFRIGAHSRVVNSSLPFR
jgi:hypothetical protein